MTSAEPMRLVWYVTSTRAGSKNDYVVEERDFFGEGRFFTKSSQRYFDTYEEALNYAEKKAEDEGSVKLSPSVKRRA